MIESAIFFLVGFLTASFLALLAVPAISRRARRLAAARERLQAPLSEAQARAERDALRGIHAVEQVRLERRLSAAENVAAIHRIELGRQASRVVALEDVGAERAAEIARQRAELTGLQSEVRESNVQLGSQEIALRDFTFQRDQARREFALARARVSELETMIDDDRAIVASLEARVTSLRVEISSLRRAASAAESERVRLSQALAERTGAADRLTRELEAAGAREASLLLEVEGGVAEAARLRARVRELEPRLAQSEASREEAMVEASRQLVLLAERDVELHRAEATRRDLTQQMARQAEAADAKQETLATQNQALSTSYAAMDGALRAVRSERADLQREVERLRTRLAEAAQAAQTVFKGDQALRQSIARLGRDFAREHASVEEEEPLAAQIVSFARREFPADPPVGSAHRQDQPIASEG